MFKHGGATRMGVVHGGHVTAVPLESGVASIMDWLRQGADSHRVGLAVQGCRSVPLAEVDLLPPIHAPGKFLAIGANYQSHLDRLSHLGLRIPEHQIWFNKQSTCVAGPHDPVVMPRVSNCLDYECELVLVIGRRCRHVSAADAPTVVAGYMVGNDFSVRDWQLRTQTMMLGKSFDTHGPIGPWLVTSDEIGDPHRLRMRTWVNGELRQDGNTAEMRHRIWQQIEQLSSVMTLEPGDLITTGTPAGTVIEQQPPRYLQVGDRVRVEIEQVGAIENRIVADAERSYQP